MMKRFFSSHLSAGLLTAAITAALFVKIGVLAFPIIGLTHGIATRNLRSCLVGLITSAGLGALALILTPAFTDAPAGPAFDWYGLIYVNTLLGALIGTALQLRDKEIIFTAILSSAVSLAGLVLVAWALRGMWQLELRMLERWEYATIIMAVPVIGVGVWWPVETVKNRLSW